MNRVLTLAEVLALDGGREVCVEDKHGGFDPDTFTVRRNDGKVWLEDAWGDRYQAELMLIEGYRVWSLPQPPTPEELAANPWPSVTE